MKLENIARTAKQLSIGIGLAATALFSPLDAQQPKSSLVIDRSHAVAAAATPMRKDTRFIILHATNAPFKSSLGSLTRLHHAHYLVNRDGSVYSLVNRNHYANHAGHSLWNGVPDISNHSVGIEIVGPGDGPFTNSQYRSVSNLVKQLQSAYHLSDSEVLGHYQVACCRENIYQRAENKKLRLPNNMPHRGGRLEPALDWHKLGIRHRTDDPDVASGRLHMNQALASWVTQHQGRPVTARSYVITNNNSAWDIAGDMYNEESTIYTFPDGTTHVGSRIGHWNSIPAGTRVRLNSTLARQPFIRTIHAGETAWDVAGRLFEDSSTFYILPDHSVERGNQIDETAIPPGTMIVVGARGPYTITNNRSAWSIAGRAYNTNSAAYITKDSVLLGNAARHLERMRTGTMVLLRNP